MIPWSKAITWNRFRNGLPYEAKTKKVEHHEDHQRFTEEATHEMQKSNRVLTTN